MPYNGLPGILFHTGNILKALKGNFFKAPMLLMNLFCVVLCSGNLSVIVCDTSSQINIKKFYIVPHT